MSEPRTTKRRRPLTGGSLHSSPKKSNLPIMDLKTAISSAKEKFEADLAVATNEPSPDKASESDNRKTASAPASPGKALSVMLPSYESSSKRPRLSNRSS